MDDKTYYRAEGSILTYLSTAKSSSLLKVDDVAKTLGIDRDLLLEAIKRLQDDGLLEIKSIQMTVVKTGSKREPKAKTTLASFKPSIDHKEFLKEEYKGLSIGQALDEILSETSPLGPLDVIYALYDMPEDCEDESVFTKPVTSALQKGVKEGRYVKPNRGNYLKVKSDV